MVQDRAYHLALANDMTGKPTGGGHWEIFPPEEECPCHLAAWELGSHLATLRGRVATWQNGQIGKAWGFDDITELPQMWNYYLQFVRPE